MIRAGILTFSRKGLWLLLPVLLAAPATRAQTGGGNPVTGALRGITNLFNRGPAASPTTLPTSTIGIRGLGAEDIANAQPNPAAVGQMEALRVDEAQARGFAAESALTPVAVAPLPAPALAPAAAPPETTP